LAPTDARPAGDPNSRRAPEPEEDALGAKLLQWLRGGFLVILWGSLFVAGIVLAIVGDGGYLDRRKTLSELRTLEESVKVQEERVAVLRQEVERLRSDPTAMERIAREQLGFVEPGEISFLLPPKEQRGPASTLHLPPPAPKKAKPTAAAADRPRD
jgi:cell division protein FtsB